MSIEIWLLLGGRIRIVLATFLRDVTATFLSVTDTYIRTYVHTHLRTHIMRIDPGLDDCGCVVNGSGAMAAI